MKTPELFTTPISNLMRTTLAWAALALVAATSAFGDTPPQEVKFGIVSDPHIYDTRLGVGGSAWDAYLAKDPKMLAESSAILDAVIDSLIAQKVSFVLIPGDLTKDGEMASHVLAAKKLEKLRKNGIRVFVVPGNHDINNANAQMFKNDRTKKVPSASVKSFPAQYRRFGYGQAISCDKDSLSYLAEPVKGVWLIAIDTCKPELNPADDEPVIGGAIRPGTMQWILGILSEAKAKGKQVMAMSHHGINLHFPSEMVLFPDYLVDDWQTVGPTLAYAGLRVVFTGHYHSQDASFLVDEKLQEIPALCDVETSSLVTYPAAFRVCSLNRNGDLKITSQVVDEINYDTGGLSFPEYAYAFAWKTIPSVVVAELMEQFHLNLAEAQAIAPLVAQAIIANYGGNENPSEETLTILNGMTQSDDLRIAALGRLVLGIWYEFEPDDHELVLSLD